MLLYHKGKEICELVVCKKFSLTKNYRRKKAMKRRMHKGFTLVELLIVIGIIGLLSLMALIGGSEANNIASANKYLKI